MPSPVVDRAHRRMREDGVVPLPLGSALDRATRSIWRVLGRPVDLAGPDHWLAEGPRNPPGGHGDAWLDQLEAGGRVGPPGTGDGLLADMSELDGPGFQAAQLDPLVRAFYERTAGWQMDVWSAWRFWAAPPGELIARLYGRRVRQLALPVQPLQVSRGMDSTVRLVLDDAGGRHGAAWLRTLRLDGSAVYSGYYRVGRLPSQRQPRVHVTFPLERGNVQVFLRPEVGQDGSLWLRSDGRRWGDDGAYVLAGFGPTGSERWFAAHTPIRETFHVYRNTGERADPEGVLRTDHWLHVYRAPALQLHYRLTAG